jgi:hypothetical protein
MFDSLKFKVGAAVSGLLVAAAPLVSFAQEEGGYTPETPPTVLRVTQTFTDQMYPALLTVFGISATLGVIFWAYRKVAKR